ncbi:MAG: alpha/beta fold hydrolase, partial [Thermoanaerobaculia bacterium]
MRKICPTGAAALAVLLLALFWIAAPALGQAGTIYRYSVSRTDGSGAGDELLFVSGSRVEVFSKAKSDESGRLLAYEMDGPGLAPKALRVWELFPGERRTLFGTVESLPAEKAVRVEVFLSGRPAETVAEPVFPWILPQGLSALGLAFAAAKDPREGFTVGVIAPNDTPNQPPLHFSGPVKVSYVGEEAREGAPVRKYHLEGEGVPNGAGFAWVSSKESRLEALEMDAGKDGPGLKLELASAQPLDAAGWEKEKRAQLGTAPGPAEAVEVKPHPCRVPNYDQEVLCATYPVWENRETRRGRKIGLNIVILPALGPDKQPDPIFELGGGPGDAITQIAGFEARSELRQKRDIVLVDQRGTGRSNRLQCSFYGEPADFRRAARELFPPEAVRRCRARLEKVADLSQYTTFAFADDLNEVRQWLGYGKINLNGGSYGTNMAQVYWRLHPETVRSVVLVGVLRLKSYIPLAHAYAGQRALDLLLAD